MLDFEILGVRKILDTEEILYLLNTGSGQVNCLVFFINNEITVFHLFYTK